jgi:hypothetical protein
MISTLANFLGLDVGMARGILVCTFLFYAAPAARRLVQFLIQISGALAGNEAVNNMALEVKKIAKINQTMAKTLRDIQKELESLRRAFDAQSRFTDSRRPHTALKRRQVRFRSRKVAVAQVNALLTRKLKAKTSTGTQTIVGATPKQLETKIPETSQDKISQLNLRSPDKFCGNPVIPRLPKVGEIAVFGLQDIVKTGKKADYHPEIVEKVRKRTLILRHAVNKTERIISKKAAMDSYILTNLPKLYEDYFKFTFFEGKPIEFAIWKTQLWKS